VKSKRKRLAMIGLLLSPVLLLFGSEVYYASSIRPRGVQTVADHYRRFGEPRRILQLQRGGTNYYELSGRAPGLAVLATPSSPPAYVYDEAGRFIDWCPDPGDRRAYRERWPQAGSQPIEPAMFRKKYGL
jgi:hypothetical protein